MDIEAIFGMISVFGVGPLILYIIYKHREKMALIKNNMHLDDAPEKKSNKFQHLRYGILLIGMAIGLIVGNYLYLKDIFSEEVSYISMIALFLGFAFLVNYFLMDKLNKDDDLV
ncbi:MAG: hypothetical protein N4A49_12090 [Marinifilaceae bacterium]|jgi:hypothetical protein|nr:hypothetical protein [Marinifilaceae bacterium]